MRLGLEDIMFADATCAFRRGNERGEVSDPVANAVECVRARMMRDIHDISGHHIVSALFQLAAIEKKLADKALPQQFEDLRKTIRHLSEDLHMIAAGGVRNGVDGDTFDAALSGLIGRWELHVAIPVQFRFSCARDLDLHDDAAQTALCVVREALTNIAKHAVGASRVTIDVILSDSLVMIVEDDGAGFTSALAERKSRSDQSLGLAGMVKRVKERGGTLEINPAADGGMRLVVTIPLEDEASARFGEAKR